MSVLVCCERSQVVTSAFLRLGIDAYSNDIMPPYGPFPDRHILGDSREVLYSRRWDLVIAHPPCTFLSHVQTPLIKHSYDRMESVVAAREFFMFFYEYPGRICIENPLPSPYSRMPPYTQLIQPYYFGDPYSKKICLWLKNLPPLMSTCICEEYSSFVYDNIRLHDIMKTYHLSRQEARSHFFDGIADAMAAQWKGYCGV